MISISNVKENLKNNKNLCKNIALGVAITIAILNTIWFFNQSNMLKFYLPSTIIGLILVFYGTFDRKEKK